MFQSEGDSAGGSEHLLLYGESVVVVVVVVVVMMYQQVGGEDRLCLTQLLQLVLHSQPLSKIHQVDSFHQSHVPHQLKI